MTPTDFPFRDAAPLDDVVLEVPHADATRPSRPITRAPCPAFHFMLVLASIDYRASGPQYQKPGRPSSRARLPSVHDNSHTGTNLCVLRLSRSGHCIASRHTVRRSRAAISLTWTSRRCTIISEAAEAGSCADTASAI